MESKEFEKAREQLKKQKYGLVGKHSGVQICQWTRRSLGEGKVCWKEKFYGIKSHRCAQVSVSLFNCENKCIHCWRNTDYTIPNIVSNPENPEEIIEGLIEERRKLLIGCGGNEKVDKKKLKEALEPTLFTFSLIGEATLYPYLGEIIKLCRTRGAVTFLVTNGLNPEAIEKLEKENALPTQMTLTVNTSNEELYKIWHRPYKKNAWQKLNKTLELFIKLKGKVRRAIRLNLVKAMEGDKEIDKLSNMEDRHVKEYAELIRKAQPDFIHVDGFKSIGFARNRLSWKKMPFHPEVKAFALKLEEELKADGYRIMGEDERSFVVLLSNVKSKNDLKIKEI